MNLEKLEITCPACSAIFKRSKSREKSHPLTYCAYCGCRLHPSVTHEEKTTDFQQLFSTISLPTEKAPTSSEIQTTIGQYQILKSIGKGGMGEVFLAYDTVSGRKIALKRIRADLISHPQLQNRFLREARITSQLTHPTIIPIYSIHQEDKLVYYTMPFVEGDTLRQYIIRAKEVEKKRAAVKNTHTSIPSLIRIFLQVCQACAYAHSHGVLHRDLKPENFIVGKYGQVLILDWGLAKMISDNEEDIAEALPDDVGSKNLHRITKMGKIVGTIAFMAPERALGKQATIQTDIYSLGVILYQILTLAVPFHRKNIAHFKKNWKKEQFIAPELLAPYREVPQILSEVARKCLTVDPKNRYQSVDELIQSIESYIEGRSEWFPIRTLDVKNKNDWEFQEHILLTEHTAITRQTEASEWVNLMISKDSFPNNMKIEADVKILEGGHGIGILFSVPEAIDRRHVTEGYSLWLASSKQGGKKTKLFRSAVIVFEAPDITLTTDEWQSIKIEKIDEHIHFYLNNVLQFSYVSHIPIVGTHIGILTKDVDFEIRNLQVSIGSQNITVSCLAVPDAFLASKDYERALSEYRRIGSSFPGRQEGREALFRAGITLLEKVKITAHEDVKEAYDLAYTEFSKLRKTAGAPLEYLGKALIYETLEDNDEEVKCYELGLRRYKRHPLLLVLEEQIAFRMHESARQNRKAAYEFISLAIRFLPELSKVRATTKLLKSLEKNWEVPSFLLASHRQIKEMLDSDLEKELFRINLAFWLAKPHLIKETIDELLNRPILPIPLICDALFLLIELGAQGGAKEAMNEIRALLSTAEQNRLLACFTSLDLTLQIQNTSLEDILPLVKNEIAKAAKQKEIKTDERLLFFLLKEQINRRTFDNSFLQQLDELRTTHADQNKQQESFDAMLLVAHLFQNDLLSAEKIISKYSLAQLMDEASPLYFPYGCYLAAESGEKKALQHFSKLLETPYPRSHLLAAHFLTGNINLEKEGWLQRSFMWERRRLYEGLTLYYHVTKDSEKVNAFHSLAAKEYVHE